uniref:Testis-expressed sequence 264 protein n=1 Tax=Lepeophtheirus salmonis TaxID=72036 RepID=C1BU92_LEPSM|nr:Testis-expressed sequence 264 protein precursor [Lepeophtheirus salmonis]
MLFLESTGVELFLVLGLLLACLVALYLYAVYSGLSHRIAVGTKEPDVFGEKGLVVAYKTGKGPFKECGSLFSEAYSLLPTNNTIGLYYDDPESVPSNETRYAVGSILSQSRDGGIKNDELQTMIRNGYKIAHFPKPTYAVMTTFPFRTTLSIYLAVYRVYPLLKKYITSKGLCAYPAIEIYSDEIKFVMPLSRQDEFFVPEFSEEELSIATSEVSSFADSSAQYQRDADTNNDTKESEFRKPKAPNPITSETFEKIKEKIIEDTINSPSVNITSDSFAQTLDNAKTIEDCLSFTKNTDSLS